MADMDSIRRDVERILEQFAKTLEGYERKDTGFFLERDRTVREPTQDSKDNAAFRDRMLANAPKHDGTSIIAERRSW